MSMYNLLEDKNYSETLSSSWQFFRDKPSNLKTKSMSFNFKTKITHIPHKSSPKDVIIIAHLKYLTKYLKTIQLPPINCEVNLVNITKKFLITETIN